MTHKPQSQNSPHALAGISCNCESLNLTFGAYVHHCSDTGLFLIENIDDDDIFCNSCNTYIDKANLIYQAPDSAMTADRLDDMDRFIRREISALIRYGDTDYDPLELTESWAQIKDVIIQAMGVTEQTSLHKRA